MDHIPTRFYSIITCLQRDGLSISHNKMQNRRQTTVQIILRHNAYWQDR